MSARATRTLAGTLALLSLAGLTIGVYLTVAHWGHQPIVCAGVGDCGYVNSSAYASLAGVPVSALGALLYATMAITASRWVTRPESEVLPIAFWGLAVSGAIYALYLTYVELAILHAICVWCVTSASILATSVGMASWAVFGVEAREPGARVSVSPAKRRVMSR